MIDHLKNQTDAIVNHQITGRDLFGTVPEIYDALRDLSPEQFEASCRLEFSRVRAVFLAMMDVNKQKVIPGTVGSKVIDAARQLRPVLDHYLGPKAPTPHATNQLTINNIGGNSHMGDKINIGGNVTGSAVGTKASLKARDIVTQIQQSGLDNELKKKFAEAAEELAKLNIDEGDKEDAADDMKKLQDELEKPARDEGRIQKIWNRIKGAAPTVASILSSAASLGKIVGVVP